MTHPTKNKQEPTSWQLYREALDTAFNEEGSQRVEKRREPKGRKRIKSGRDAEKITDDSSPSTSASLGILFDI